MSHARGLTREVVVAGATIRYRQWAPAPGSAAGLSALVLVHGRGAHRHWWDHIAPLLAQDRRVFALDLSGHGDSDRRSAYDFDTWACEVLAVADAASSPRGVVVVGHSMGGHIGLVAAATCSEQLAGVVAVDPGLRPLSDQQLAALQRRATAAPSIYRSRAEAMARFRLMPPQVALLRDVVEQVAAASVHQVGRGWTWKFDPKTFAADRPHAHMLGKPGCRVAFLRPEFGIMTTDTARLVHERFGPDAPIIEIRDAAHHVMFDQPLALMTELRTVLEMWERDPGTTR